MAKNKKKKGLRFVILNDKNQQTAFSLKLNIINSLLVFVLFGMLVIGVSFLISKVFSAVNTFSDIDSQQNDLGYKKELLDLNDKIIQLEDSLAVNDLYLKALSNVVSGNLKAEKVDSLVAKHSPVLLNHKSLKASENDSLFRIQMAKEELENLKQTTKHDNQLLFAPVKGIVTASYDIINHHLATDIAAAKGDDIKSIASGIVIFTEWTPEAGNIIMIQHKNNMVSTYKHCSQLYKKSGDEVERGDVIAAVGNGGELTTGPHLHFELWIQGKAVDAEDYINF